MIIPRDLLKKSELFIDLNDMQLENILHHSSVKSFSEGETIFNQGENADYLYVLIEGQVDLSLKDKEDVGFMTSKIEKEASVFGTPSLMEPPVYNVSARCLKPTKALAIEAKYLKNSIEADPQMGIKIMKRLASIYFNRLNELRAGVLNLFKIHKFKTI